MFVLAYALSLISCFVFSSTVTCFHFAYGIFSQACSPDFSVTHQFYVPCFAIAGSPSNANLFIYYFRACSFALHPSTLIYMCYPRFHVIVHVCSSLFHISIYSWVSIYYWRVSTRFLLHFTVHASGTQRDSMQEHTCANAHHAACETCCAYFSTAKAPYLSNHLAVSRCRAVWSFSEQILFPTTLPHSYFSLSSLPK